METASVAMETNWVQLSSVSEVSFSLTNWVFTKPFWSRALTSQQKCDGMIRNIKFSFYVSVVFILYLHRELCHSADVWFNRERERHTFTLIQSDADSSKQQTGSKCCRRRWLTFLLMFSDLIGWWQTSPRSTLIGSFCTRSLGAREPIRLQQGDVRMLPGLRRWAELIGRCDQSSVWVSARWSQHRFDWSGVSQVRVVVVYLSQLRTGCLSHSEETADRKSLFSDQRLLEEKQQEIRYCC